MSEEKVKLVTDIENQHPEIFKVPIGKFNVKDGSLNYFENLSETKEIPKVTEYEQYFWQKPKKNCRHCYERGYTGLDVLTKFYIPCRCIKPRFRTIGLRKNPKGEQK